MVTMKRSGTGRRKRLVLEAIPFDEWISACEIAKKTDMRPQAVGIIIKRNLFPVHVERRDTDDKRDKTYEYKRRPIFLETKRPRD